MADEKEETPKLSKTEEKQSFLKDLEEKIAEQKRVEQEIRSLVERNEELAARSLLGGKTDAGSQPVIPKEDTALEYTKKFVRGQIKFNG